MTKTFSQTFFVAFQPQDDVETRRVLFPIQRDFLGESTFCYRIRKLFQSDKPYRTGQNFDDLKCVVWGVKIVGVEF